jgi:hypothetical protein
MPAQSLSITAIVLGALLLAYFAVHAYAHSSIRNLDRAEALVSAQPDEEARVHTTRAGHADDR